MGEDPIHAVSYISGQVVSANQWPGPPKKFVIHPPFTATPAANRATMPRGKPQQRQVKGEIQKVLICSISILVTGSHITRVKNIEHVYYCICT